MFNLNSTSIELAKQHQEETLNNIEKQRLIELVKQPKGRHNTIVLCRKAIGNLLVKFGESLQPAIASTEPQRKISRPIG